MSSATRVPEPGLPTGDELSAGQAQAAVRRVGVGSLLRDAFVRFRHGDGFSSSRALAFQLCLAIVPLTIAGIGLTGTLHTESVGQVLRSTVVSLAPGSTDDMRRTLEVGLSRDEGEDTATAALLLGLVTGLAALTVAMGQVERGANRIYGIERDRPSLHKYARAAVLALTAGLPALLGFLLIVAGSVAADAVQQVYGVGGALVHVLRWPVSVVLSLGALTLMLRHSPRRRQPAGWSWLVPAAAASLVLWVGFSSLLGLYLRVSGTFGAIYGQLTSVMALLLWAQLTSMAVFFGVALSAQAEAARAGVADPAQPDREPADAGTSGALDRVLAGLASVAGRVGRARRTQRTGSAGGEPLEHLGGLPVVPGGGPQRAEEGTQQQVLHERARQVRRVQPVQADLALEGGPPVQRGGQRR